MRTKTPDGAYHPLKPMQQSDCRWVSAAAGKSEFEVCGVVGGKMVIELLAGTMRRGRGGIAAVEDDMRQAYTVKHIRKGLALLS